ncbi:unnamed protein product, partial [Mycena citricolor]
KAKRHSRVKAMIRSIPSRNRLIGGVQLVQTQDDSMDPRPHDLCIFICDPRQDCRHLVGVPPQQRAAYALLLRHGRSPHFERREQELLDLLRGQVANPDRSRAIRSNGPRNVREPHRRPLIVRSSSNSSIGAPERRPPTLVRIPPLRHRLLHRRDAQLLADGLRARIVAVALRVAQDAARAHPVDLPLERLRVRALHARAVQRGTVRLGRCERVVCRFFAFARVVVDGARENWAWGWGRSRDAGWCVRRGGRQPYRGRVGWEGEIGSGTPLLRGRCDETRDTGFGRCSGTGGGEQQRRRTARGYFGSRGGTRPGRGIKRALHAVYVRC